MQTARRLYVYLLSGISLGVLVTGLSLLLTVLFETVGLAGETMFDGGDATRQRLTLAAALTVVSLPVWLIHWAFAERSVRPDRPTGAAERSSDVRGLYFALAMGALLIAVAASAIGLIEALVVMLADQPLQFRNPAGNLALLLTAGAAWSYHVWLHSRDWARGPIVKEGAFLPRTYLYVATLGGLVMMLFGVTALIELAGRVVLDRPPEFVAGGGPTWWAVPLGSALAQTVVGAAIWIGHWAYANRLLADAGWRGASERPARLRLAFFVAAIVVGAGGLIGFAATAGRNAIEAALGVSDLPGGTEVVAVIVSALLSAAVFGASWWVHSRWLRGEASVSDAPGRFQTARRLEGYATSLVGLAAGGVATAWLIGVLIDVLFSGSRVLGGADFWQRELAQFAPFAVLGGVVWIWNWSELSRRRAQAPMVEAASTTRRATLLLVLAASILAGIATLGVILYRMFGTLFGVDLPGNAIAELSRPLGGLIVAAALAAYYGVALRRDQALRAAADAVAAEAAPTRPSTVTLSLSAPGDVDLEPMLAQLRGQLPAGYVLDRVSGAADT